MSVTERRAAAFFGDALKLVKAERKRIDEKFGKQDHDRTRWVAILLEEIGEYAHCLNEHRITGVLDPNALTEAVQVAAVISALSGDRGFEYVERYVNERNLPWYGHDAGSDVLHHVLYQFEGILGDKLFRPEVWNTGASLMWGLELVVVTHVMLQGIKQPAV